MANYHFGNNEFNCPTAAKVKAKWTNIGDVNVQAVISYEYQYYLFAKWAIEEIHSLHPTKSGSPHKQPLDLSIRAGSQKAIILTAASIIEACLRWHAEKRNYELAEKPKGRTFGNVLRAWTDDNSIHPKAKVKPELVPIWDQLLAMLDFRNTVHIYKSVGTASAYYTSVIPRGNAQIAEADSLIEKVRHIKTP